MNIRFSLLIALGIIVTVIGSLAASPVLRAADKPAGEDAESSSGRVDEFEQKEEGDDSANQSEAADNQPDPEPEQQPQRKGGSRAKEAEGSKAPNRFEADVVTKSSYKLAGESLEVDPD